MNYFVLDIKVVDVPATSDETGANLPDIFGLKNKENPISHTARLIKVNLFLIINQVNSCLVYSFSIVKYLY